MKKLFLIIICLITVNVFSSSFIPYRNKLSNFSHNSQNKKKEQKIDKSFCINKISLQIGTRLGSQSIEDKWSDDFGSHKALLSLSGFNFSVILEDENIEPKQIFMLSIELCFEGYSEHKQQPFPFLELHDGTKLYKNYTFESSLINITLLPFIEQRWSFFNVNKKPIYIGLSLGLGSKVTYLDYKNSEFGDNFKILFDIQPKIGISFGLKNVKISVNAVPRFVKTPLSDNDLKFHLEESDFYYSREINYIKSKSSEFSLNLGISFMIF